MRFDLVRSRIEGRSVVGAGVLALLSLLPSLAGAETRVGGAIQGTVTWNKEGSPYVVTDDLLVEKDATLRIGPGVTVRFKADIASRGGVNVADLELVVEGKLVVEGAANDTVLFTSAAEIPKWWDWQGIVVQGPTARAEIKAAILEYAIQGVRCHDGSLAVKDLTIRRCRQHGIMLHNAKADIDHVIITEVGNAGGTGAGINLEKGAQASIQNSFIIGVQNGIIYSQKSGGPLEGTVVTMCLTRGVLIHNSIPEVRHCLITGNKVGVIVSGGANPVVKENNIFENSAGNVEVKGFDQEPVKLDFSRNWWGDTALGIIEDGIHDGSDDPALKAFVVLEPVLTEAVTLQTESPVKP